MPPPFPPPGGPHFDRHGDGDGPRLQQESSAERLRPSRHRFRDFLKARGLFGTKLTDEEEKKAAEAEAKAQAPGPDGKPVKKGHFPYVWRYIKTLRNERWRLAAILALTVLSVGLSAAMPWTSKFMIDHVLAESNYRLLMIACAVLLSIYIISNIAAFLEELITRAFLGNFVAATKRSMMKHLQRLPLQRLQELKVGGIATRLQSDTEAMAGLLMEGVLMPIRALIRLGMAVGSLLFINWEVALVCFSFSLLLVGVSYFIFNKLRPLQKLLREEVSLIGGRLTESFSGIQVIRAFGRERPEAQLYSLDINTLWRKYMHTNILAMAVHRIVWLINSLLVVTIWGFGGYQVIGGRMSVGDIVAFIAFVDWLFQPIFMIMHSFSNIQTSLASAERVFDLMDEPRHMPDKPDAVAIERLESGLRFENTTFDYPNGTRALHSINLAIPKGKITALVGPSGAGKSTIANLVMRFYDATEGALLVDERDIRSLQLASYRRLCSLVLQEVFLFDGTVRENIAYGYPEASIEKVKQAAAAAHCHDFVAKLERGYDTIVGERGVRLSMGQKQRIALARAILVDPQILILDEATSSLDSESEAFIQDALRSIFKNRTTLVIAHRLSTIIDADKIVVVEKGKIAEEGSHTELLARQGRYSELYAKQMEKAERRKAIFDWNEEVEAAGDETEKAK